MEAELVAVTLILKEKVVFCSNMMLELGFDKRFGSVFFVVVVLSH